MNGSVLGAIISGALALLYLTGILAYHAGYMAHVRKCDREELAEHRNLRNVGF